MKPKKEEVPRDEPGEEDAEAHEALLNWAAWCVWRKSPGKAGSAEGNYRPEAGNVHQGLSPSTRVDVPMAELVNTALLAIPESQRMALHMRYYLRMPDRGIAGACGVPAGAYLRFMSDARKLLWAAVLLSRQTKPIIPRDNSREPIADDDVEPFGRAHCPQN